MGKQRDVGCYRVEYEIHPSLSSWTAFVIAYNPEEVLEYLEQLIGKGKINLTQIGFQCNIHGITPQVRELLVPPVAKPKKTANIPSGHLDNGAIGELEAIENREYKTSGYKKKG